MPYIFFKHSQILKIFLKAFLLTPLIFGGFFIAQSAQAAGPTYVHYDINEPTVWTKENSPYVIDWWMTININSTLTIEHGVVLKIQPDRWNDRYSGLRVNGDIGKIIALGTESDPIVFTSYFDHEYAPEIGDSADPQRGDWESIIFVNDDSILDQVIVRYAGHGRYHLGDLVFGGDSRARMQNSTVEFSSTYGIEIKDNARPTLENLVIQNNQNTAIAVRNNAGPGVLKNSLIRNNEGQYLMDIDADSLFQFEGNTFETNKTRAISLSGTASREATWQNLGVPYFMQAGIAETGIVHIEPGAVFKFDLSPYNTVRMKIQGALDAQGTEINPIIFTSILDDTAGGDTNNDGDATSPAPNNWGELAFDNATATSTLDYTEVRYGGEYNGDFSGIFYATSHNDSIYIKNSPVIINHSKISYGKNTGILCLTGCYIDIQNSHINNHQTGIAIADDTASMPIIKNNRIYGNTNYGLSYWGTPELDATMNWWGNDSGPTHPNNPSGTGDTISGNILFDPWTGKTQELDPVILIPGIMGSWNVTGKWELDPILHTYDNLWVALKNAGYKEGKTLFAFPYQWRVSNELTAYDLMRKIDEVQEITGKNKVDIIAHSMGGLITRYYIENELYLEDDDDFDNIDIDQVIFLGTPHQGATKAYLTWEGGKLGPYLDDYIKEKIFTVEADFNGFGSVYQYVRGLPITSVKELLPIYDYLRDKDTMELRAYPNDYPTNEFLEDLNSQEKIGKMNNARGLNIIGKRGEDSTINILRVVDNRGSDGEWEFGYPEKFNNLFFGGDYGIEKSEGDITVPNRSNNSFGNWQTYEINEDHNALPTESQKIIIKELTGNESSDFVHLNYFQKAYLVRIFSPADFQIIDPQGRKIGKDFINNSAINEIPNAFYSGFQGGAEFAVIPDPLDGEYKIIVKGIASGNYDLSTSIISDNYALDSFVQDVPVSEGQENIFTSNLDTASTTNPVINLEPLDTTPPAVTINSPKEKQYLHSDIIPVDYQITDESATKETLYFDSVLFEENQIDGFFQELGIHQLKIDALDKFNNSSTVTFEIIATLDSLYRDIGRAYSLGWIKNTRTRDTALNLVNNVRNWYNKYELLKQTNPVMAKLVKTKLISLLATLKTSLNLFEKLRVITHQANQLIFKQIEYIINNL